MPARQFDSREYAERVFIIQSKSLTPAQKKKYRIKKVVKYIIEYTGK